MKKLLEYGRKAWFVIKVLSGYEERRIRAYRLKLQEKIQRAQARKEEVSKIPEQVILSEVRRMVEEMQRLNQLLNETENVAEMLVKFANVASFFQEAQIEKHFKQIDTAAHIMMDVQLEREESRTKDLMKVMQDQAMMQREATMRSIKAANQQKEINRPSLDSEDPAQQAQEQNK